MINTRRAGLLTGIVIAIFFTHQNCSKVKFSSNPETVGTNTPNVCDPMGGGGGTSTSGLQGQLYYLEPPPDSSSGFDLRANYYFTSGHHANANIYMNTLNVPTRAFNAGFQTTNGSTLTTASGAPLYEWFALRFRTRLKLKGGEPAGQYQLGILSDDGSIVRLDTGNRAELINNDYVTPTRFAYAQQPLTFDGATRLPVEIDYYQGPKDQIAIVLMWRQWNGNAYDPAGGQAGKYMYFDSRLPGSPAQPAYNDLLARGWKPLTVDNFELADDNTNPCN